MNISTIQKRKFLNNIYKLYYSSGKRPTEQDIRSEFNKYFNVNKLGQPLTVDYSLLQSIDTTDVDVLNELMANTLLNLEILYDCILENNQESFYVVNTLNNKLENLRSKRKALESKVDELIFMNNNSDGYFYSFLEGFSSLENIDISNTTAYVDVSNGQVSIPKITSNLSNAITLDTIKSTGVTYNVKVNNTTVVQDTNINDIESIFDGLNDTYWSVDHYTEVPSIVSLTLNIPVSTNFNISNLSGVLLTSAPCSVYATCTPSNSAIPSENLFKDSKKDYNRFSFAVPSRSYSSISITLMKVEPDALIPNSDIPYRYSFGIRELIIGSEYHETSATLVSAPISIPSQQNENLVIASVGMEVDSQMVGNTSAKYYIAQNTNDNGQITDFNWIPIEPMSFNNNSFDKIVNLFGTNQMTKYIDTVDSDLYTIPVYSSENINESNPILIPNTDVTAYRVAAVYDDQKYIDPYMLAGIGSIKHYYTLGLSYARESSLVENYKSPDFWSSTINENIEGTIYSSILSNQTGQVTLPNSFPSSGILKFKLYSDNAATAIYDIIKGSSEFNLAVYLNGSLIGDLGSGILSSPIEWNFVQGINTVEITYDKDYSGLINFNIMAGARLVDYGTMFLDYYKYLDPIEFRRRANSSLNVFTIDSIYNKKEILASNEISTRTLFRYYTSTEDVVNSIRYRIDLNRYNNPLQTPIVDAVRIKFRHRDSQVS